MGGTAACTEAKPGCLSALTSCFHPKKKPVPAAKPVSQPQATSVPAEDTRVTPVAGDLFKSSGATEAPSPATPPASKPVEVSRNYTIDLWLVAYEKTDARTKEWIGNFGIGRSSNIQAQELTKLVRAKEETGLTVDGKKILWRNYANRVVAWVTTIL